MTREARYNRTLLVVGAFCLGLALGVRLAPDAGGIEAAAIKSEVARKLHAAESGTKTESKRNALRAPPRPPSERPVPATSARQNRAPAPRSVTERIADAWPGDDAKAIRVVGCETGGTFNPRILSQKTRPIGLYRGLWQFDLPTWRSVGGSGDPIDASVEEQTRRAWALYQKRGWGPWPECGKK